MLNRVLIRLADDNGTMTMCPVQRRKLLELVSNMAGKDSNEMTSFYDALEPSEAALPGVEPEGSEISELSTKDALDRLVELKAFGMIMGLEDPGDGGGGGISSSGGSPEQETEPARSKSWSEGSWQARADKAAAQSLIHSRKSLH